MRRALEMAVTAVVVLAFCAPAPAVEEAGGAGELRGVFLRAVGKEINGRVQLLVEIRPQDGKDPVTVLVPIWRGAEGAWVLNKDMLASVISLREGQKLEIAFEMDAGQRWARRIEAERRGEPAEGERAEGPERREAQQRDRAERREQRGREEGERAEPQRPERRREGKDQGPRREAEGRADRPREGQRAEGKLVERRREGEARRVPEREGERRPAEDRQARRSEAENEELRALLGKLLRRLEQVEQELKELRAQVAGGKETPGRP